MDDTRTLTAPPAVDDLERARSVVGPGLRAAIQPLSPPVRRVVGFHFGWWDQDGNTLRTSGGKAVRPALALLSAEACGGTADGPAAAAAVALELVHNFSLLHDDVMDQDRTRRHRPTTWAAFGVPAAILAGDALLTLATDVLAAAGSPALASEGVHRLSAAVVRLIDGQTADVAFESRTDVRLAECLTMARDKTGALLGCACELGALAAGAPPDRATLLGAFGDHLGLAFQLVDDLLGIWGDPGVTGKPVMADLRARKKSLPVVAALTAGTPDAEALAGLYHAAGPLDEDALRRAAALVERAGGRRWAADRAATELDTALRMLHEADPRPGAGDRLVALAHRLASRDQ